VTASTRAPAWTESNDSDPGITLVQLFAFVAVVLLFGFALQRWRTARAGR
jgi:hypothetical protein